MLAGMELRSERLILREYVEADWQAMFGYQAAERYWRYYEAGGRRTEAGARQMVRLFCDWQQTHPRLYFQMAVALKSDGRLIGSCGLRVRRLVDHGRPDAGWEADIGYDIDPELWGQGYASEAAARIVRFGFDELSLHRVWAYCISDNRGSWRVMEKIGMRQEGLLRQNEFMQDRWWDSRVYGLLASEWREHTQA